MYDKLDTIQNELKEREAEKETLDSIRRLTEAFVSDDTLIQILESHALVAYIITFKTEEGRFAELLDELLDEDTKNIFWFTKYGLSSRIGIIPRDMTFEQLVEEFEEALTSKANGFRSNVIIQSFAVSAFNSKQIPLGKGYKSAMEKIRELLAKYMSPEDLRIYFRYGILIGQTFEIRSFAELIRDYLTKKLPDKLSAIHTKCEENNIMEVLIREFHCDSVKALAKTMLTMNKTKAINLIDKVLSQHLNILTDDERDDLAKATYRRLRDIARVWSHLFY